MSTVTFLSNDTLWQALLQHVKAAKHVDAAIAYFGNGGAKLLPLRRGDRLVVDMSPATVRAGGTDPREIEKLIKRGVQAFTRRNLHAKVIVADDAVISGSANISHHAQQQLDEAAIITNHPAASRRAREFIDRLSTEPIRAEYLAECKRIYRPPRFNGQPAARKQQQQRATHAKLWIVNLNEGFVPESEIDRYEQGEAKAEKLLKDGGRSETDSFHWPRKPRMATELELGDWVIEVIRNDDKSIDVYPPGQFLFLEKYIRDARTRKERWVFHLDVPRGGETMSWGKFRRAAKSVAEIANLVSPRTKPIRDIHAADSLLSLWTPGGRTRVRHG